MGPGSASDDKPLLSGGATTEQWVLQAARAASRDAGDVPVELLGDYLPMLVTAARSGELPPPQDLDSVRAQGRCAAQLRVPVGRGVDLYLSTARHVWAAVPAVDRERDSTSVRAAAEAVLRVVDNAVALFVEGHAEAGRELVRREETIRRELIEDLLRGGANLTDLVARAEPFGLDLTQAHQVALARTEHPLPSVAAATAALERTVMNRFGDRDVLVTTKEDLVVVVAPADLADGADGSPGRRTAGDVGRVVLNELGRTQSRSRWRVAVGRPYPGAHGIARSYEEARESLAMAVRMKLVEPLTETRDVLTYRVLARDQLALVDLVSSVLTPLTRARGGAEPLVATLATYFDSGCVATTTAHALHLSVRAVTYRLDRVRALSGFDPAEPAQRFTLQAAVLGARLLGWPDHPLPPSVDRT